MRYKFSLQERSGEWIYVLNFGKDTPTELEDVIEYSDDGISAMDYRNVRHYAYFKNGFLISIHLHDVLELLPDVDPDRPETLKMPGMHAIMFGNPPGVPTLLLQFQDAVPSDRTAWAICANVFMMFDEKKLALLYVTDVYSMIAEVD